jgi:hypothetical protein
MFVCTIYLATINSITSSQVVIQAVVVSAMTPAAGALLSITVTGLPGSMKVQA